MAQHDTSKSATARARQTPPAQGGDAGHIVPIPPATGQSAAAGDVRAATDTIGTLLDSVLDSVGTGLMLFDTSLAITHRNSVAAELLPDADTIDVCLDAARFDAGQTEWRTQIREIIDGGNVRRFDPLCRTSADGEPRYFRLTIAPMSAPSSGGGLLVIEETTSRISMEQRLAVSERLAALGQLSARVAHELNNPLDGILRYVNLCLRVSENLGDENLLRYLDQARSGLMRMAGIVRSLLEFSRGGYQGPQDASVTSLIDDAIRALEAQAAESNVSIVCSFDGEDLQTPRAENLFQVFCNVIKNAIDAMPQGGRIFIRTACPPGAMTITIEDTGCGLPEPIDRLFEPFYTTKPTGKGTGLGLAVCRDILSRYGGSITATNRDGGGAAFIITLPGISPAATDAENAK